MDFVVGIHERNRSFGFDLSKIVFALGKQRALWLLPGWGEVMGAGLRLVAKAQVLSLLCPMDWLVDGTIELKLRSYMHVSRLGRTSLVYDHEIFVVSPGVPVTRVALASVVVVFAALDGAGAAVPPKAVLDMLQRDVPFQDEALVPRLGIEATRELDSLQQTAPPVFAHPLTARFTDEDSNRHVGHSIYCKFMEDTLFALEEELEGRAALPPQLASVARLLADAPPSGVALSYARETHARQRLEVRVQEPRGLLLPMLIVDVDSGACVFRGGLEFGMGTASERGAGCPAAKLLPAQQTPQPKRSKL